MDKKNIIITSAVVLALDVLIVAAGVAACFYQEEIMDLFNKDKAEVVPEAVCDESFPIAYVNLDTLLVEYDFAVDAQDRLMSKQEDARVKLASRYRTFENEYADFQRKAQAGAFLSQQRYESEANKLQKKQQELQELEAKLTQDLMIENQDLNIQLADSLMEYLKVFNADGRYKMILTNNGHDNVLIADEGLNITPQVVAGLNARYNKAQ